MLYNTNKVLSQNLVLTLTLSLTGHATMDLRLNLIYSLAEIRKIPFSLQN